MNDSAGQVRYDITANADDFLDQLRAAGRAIDAFGDRVSEADKQLIRDWNNLADEMSDAIARGAIEASRPIADFCSETISQISQMNSSIVQAGLSSFQILSGAAATSLMGLASKGLQGADDLAKYNAQIIGMANSTEDANSAMSEAVKFFKQNPFQRFETVEAVKNLMTYDKSIADAASNSERLTQTLDMLGVASLSTNVPIAELASKWGEVTSQARISKGQFEELAMRVPALYDAVGKKMGKSAGEVSDALNRVGIDTQIVKDAMMELYGLDTTKLNLPKNSKEFQEYFNSLSGAARQSAEAYLAFGNTMARQTDRVNGRIANLAQKLVGYELDAQNGFKAMEGGIYQSVINLKRAFADAFSTDAGEKLYAALDKLGKQIAPIIDKIADKIPFAIEKLADAADFLAEHFDYLKIILGGALILFGRMADKIPILGNIVGQFTGPLKNLLGVFTKFNPLVQTLMALLGAGAFKAIKDGKLNEPLKSILSSLERIGKALKPVVERVMEIMANIGETIVVSLIESLARVLEVLANVLEKIPPEVLTGIVMGILSFRTISSVAEPIAQTVKSFKSLKDSVTAFFDIKSKALGGIDKIKNALNGISGTADSAKKAAEDMSGATGSVNSISKSASKMDTRLSKVDKVLGSIVKGAGAVILIAAAIAATAGALKLTHELLKDVKLLDLLKELGTLLLVVIASAAVMGIIGTFGKYAVIGSIASIIISGGLLVSAIALSKVGNYTKNISLVEILKLESVIAIVSLILAAISGFALFGAIGSIASSIISGGLLLSAMALSKVSDYTKNINMDAIVELSEVIAIVSTILGLISGLAIFGAIGSIASSILSGGLLVSAIALEETSKHVSGIDMDAILHLSEILVQVDIILGIISGFAVLGAISAIANDIIAGGLLVAAIALQETSKHSSSSEIKLVNIQNLYSIITEVDLILAVLSGFAVLGSISAIANDIISGGLLVAAIALQEVSKRSSASSIKLVNIRNLNSVITETNAILSVISLFSGFAAIGTIINDVIAGGLLLAAKCLVETSSYAKQLSEGDFTAIQNILTKLSELGTGNVFSNLSNLINSNLLSDIANNVSNIINKFAPLKPINNEIVDSIKQNIESLSGIKIQGSGLFENKGGAAEELEKVINHVANISRTLKSSPAMDYGKTESFVNAIKLFDRVDDKAKNGIKRLSDLKDSLSNIDWIKHILGDVPENIWSSTERFVNSIKLFDRIDDNARNGALKLKDMGDSLGNIDWIKHILGDIQEDLPQRTQYLVDSLKKLAEFQLTEETISSAATSARNLINEFLNGMNSLIPQIQAAGENIQGTIWNAIEPKLQDEYFQGAELVRKFAEGMGTKQSELQKAGADVQGTIWNAIEPKLKDEYYQGQTLAQNLINGFNSKHQGDDTFYNAGANAVQGFINGANSKNVYSVGWQIASSYLQGLKDKGKQGSPWKTTYQSGIWAVEGMIDGIEKMKYKLVDTAESISELVIESLSIEDLADAIGFNNLKNLSMTISGQGEEGTLGGVNQKSNTINIYNNNYAQSDFNKISRDIMFNISRL